MGGGRAWLLGGACVVFSGGAWFFMGGVHGFLGGVHGFFWGACMVFSRGACVVFSGGVCIGYNEIRSMSRQYASYWNAFLFARRFTRRIRRICGLLDTMS